MIRFYVIPAETQVDPFGSTTRGPAHLAWYQTALNVWFPTGGIVCQWSAKDYGDVDRMIVAVETDATTHDAIAAFADVLALPENLDQLPGASARNAIKNRLETFNIPSGWIVAGMTYREILRIVLGMFMFMQRLQVRSPGNIFKRLNITLDTTFGELGVGAQQVLRDSANSLGYNGDAIPANWTIRQILKYAADQWGDAPILFGFVTL